MNLVLWVITAAHAMWGIIYLTTPLVIVTAPTALFRGLPNVAVGLALLVVSATATVGLTKGQWPALLPQQAIVLLTMFDSGAAILTGTYPDGTPRWPGFIMVDQVTAFSVMAAYTYLVGKHIVEWFKPWQQ